MPVTSSWRKRVAGACAAALAVPLALSAGVASAAPTPASPGTVAPAALGAPTASGAYVAGPLQIQDDGQTYLYNVWSPAMQRMMPIEMLVPKEYDRNAATTYPEVYQLDGLRADPNITDWSRKADTHAFFASKQVLVVQPIGGYGSFFQNWAKPDAGILNQGKQTPISPPGKLQWETFLTAELPGIIDRDFHGDSAHRAITGLSMGGFSAFSLAAKHKDLYVAAASYSGYLDSQAVGLPEFLEYVLNVESLASDANNMWGTPDQPAWKANNPTQQVANLAGMTLYASAGTGLNGPYDAPLGFGGLSSSFVGAILELVANYSTQSFVQVATAANVDVTTDLTHPGIHDWPYWSDDYKRSWPTLAKALGVEQGFAATGAIGAKWNQLGGAGTPGGGAGFLGVPTSAEYDVPGGRAQNFTVGKIYWSPATGAHEVQGFILDAWGQEGFESSRYGFPTSDEMAIPGVPGGRQSIFQGGTISFIKGKIVLG